MRRLLGLRKVTIFYTARLVPGVFNFLLVLVLSQRLDAAHYGWFSVWLALILGLGFFFFGWLSQAIARHANGHEDLLSKSPETFAFGAVLACALVAAAAFAAPFVDDTLRVGDALLVAAGAILWGVHSILSAVMQARFRLKGYAVIEAVRPIATFVGAVAAVELAHPTYREAALGFVIGQCVALGIAMAAVSVPRLVGVTRTLASQVALRKIGMQKVRAMLAYGAPISAWLGLMTVWPAIDRRILGWLSTPHEVGIYAAEYDVAFRSFVFALLPITLFLQPKIFKAHAQDGVEGVGRLVRSGIRSQLLVGSAFAVAYSVAILGLAPRFGLFTTMRAADVMVLCLAAIAWQVALLCHKWLECAKCVGAMLFALVAVLALVSIPVSLALFDRLGSAAFALGFLLAGGAYSSFCYFYGKHRLRLAESGGLVEVDAKIPES